MLGTIVIFNNFFHDLAAALWFSSWFLIYYLRKQAERVGESQILIVLRLFWKTQILAYLSLLFIIVGGVVRTVYYSKFEYLPAAGRGQINLLFLKHFLFFTLVVIGYYLQRDFYRRILTYKEKLSGKSLIELEKVLKPHYYFQNLSKNLAKIRFNNKYFVLLFLYIFTITVFLSVSLGGRAISNQNTKQKTRVYEYDLAIENIKFNLPLQKVYPQSGVHLLEYKENAQLSVFISNVGQREMNDVLVVIEIIDQGWGTKNVKEKALGTIKPEEKRKIIFGELQLKQGTVNVLVVNIFSQEKDGDTSDNEKQLKFKLGLKTTSGS